MDKLTAIATKQLHPAKKPIGYVVKKGGVVYYGPHPYGLCKHYINIHSLTNINPFYK